MFSGIGYFSIPLAIHSGCLAVISIEKNPNSFALLCENIKLNHIPLITPEDLRTKLAENSLKIPLNSTKNPFPPCSPLLGDNCEVGCEFLGLADRVSMGYIPTPVEFIPRALAFLNAQKGGIVHYHYICPKEDIKAPPCKDWSSYENQKECGLGKDLKPWLFEIKEYRIVKNYAPGIVHCVADIYVKNKENIKMKD
jgi:tRNA wybutosine-synthesizing protein 2